MAISPFTPGALTRSSTDYFVSMRRDLENLQRQLVTGQKADTYGGLGFERRMSLDIRGRLAAIDGYTSAIDQTDLRIKMMVQNLERLGELGSDTKSDLTLSHFALLSDGRTFAQKNAEQRLKEALDLLNVDIAGRSLFAGRAVDKVPVETYDRIMNGDGVRAGLKQLISERTQAELGADGMGRLATSTTATTVRIAGETALPSFGFKVAGASATGAAITAAVAAGPPADAVFTLGGLPSVGDTITVTLTDPDGATHQVKLTASATAPQPGSTDTFQIGATVADTVTNLEAALSAAVKEKAATTLQPRAAMLTTEAFFAATPSAPPQRVAGPPPFTGATAMVAGTAADTLIWYNGDDDPAVAARDTGPVRIDQSQVVGAGARANEPGIRNVLAQLAVLAAESFANTKTDAARYDALSAMVSDKLADKPSNPKVSEIATELANASATMTAAKERHQSTESMLLDAIQGVEQVSKEETAAAILDLQNRLQASYQTTSILSQLSLVNYL